MAGLGIAQMTSLLVLANKMANMDTLSTERTRMQGRLRIEQDEDIKAELQEKLDAIERSIADTAGEAQSRIEADHEKIREERAEMRQEFEERLDAVRENNRVESPKVVQPDKPTTGAESSEPPIDIDTGVTVDISTYGLRVVVFSPKPVPTISSPTPSNIGNNISISI